MVFLMKGKLKSVDRIFRDILGKLSDKFEELSIQNESGIRMLIPNNYVI